MSGQECSLKRKLTVQGGQIELHGLDGGGTVIGLADLILQVPQTVGVSVFASGDKGARHGDLNLHAKCGL